MNAIDLHVHSVHSDGTYTVNELIDYAIDKKLHAIALTDHDTISGIQSAISYAYDKPIEIVPGVELSSDYMGKDIHILGLLIDYNHPVLTHFLEEFQNNRVIRNQKMCEKLQDLNVPVFYEQLIQRFPNSVLTRGHFAKFLYEQGFSKSMKEAFEQYVGDYGKCFVPKMRIKTDEAINLIHQANGLAILAHPTLYHFNNNLLNTFIEDLSLSGLDGIEGIYCTYTPSEERLIRSLAQKHNLLITGGSDFHGSNKKGLDLGTGYGSLYIPKELLSQLKDAQKKIYFDSDYASTIK